MKLIIDNKIMIQEAPDSFLSTVKDILAFPNPKWIENDKRGYWNGKIAKELRFFDQTEKGLIIPRGFIRHLIDMAKAQGIRYTLQDHRRTLPEVDIIFNGELKPFQKAAVQDILQHDFGTLSAPTGSGKTCIALYSIAQRKQPALVVVHTVELQRQWISRIGTFLNIPAKDIGVIGNGKKTIGDRITVATVQSLYKCAEEIRDSIGFLIVDECHRTPSRIFSEAVTAFDSRYMLGLSATPWRRDKLSRLIYWHIGDVIHRIGSENLLRTKDILPVEIITRRTKFRSLFNPSEQYSKMLSELTQDIDRNLLIVQDVARETRKGKSVSLVLSDRKAHCEVMQDLLWCKHNIRAELLTGDTPKAKRESIIDKLNTGKVRVLIATGQLIGEGFDAKQLSTLFLTTPIRFNGRVIQYLGRVLRPAPGKKKARVYDYVDSHVGPLKASARSRQKVYRQAA
ncbi:MAG: DEAD/DEAH box helicase [Dissulfuribacterales bacterium]